MTRDGWRTGRRWRRTQALARWRRRRRRIAAPELVAGARDRLRRFRQKTTLAIATTGLLLALWGGAASSQSISPASGSAAAEVADAGPAAQAGTSPAEGSEPSDNPVIAAREAAGTVRALGRKAWGLLPKLLVAAAILLVAAVLARLIRWFLRRLLRSWDRGSALGALVGVAIYLLALGAALSVIAGDARALVGSIGLTGLALSWALQTPIESFTGWLLNSFRGYYRVGDRIAVGDVFGDVYAIDFLTTTVWEAGGPGKPVQGAQPTGALITFPNHEVLRNNIVNYTREFAHVWDEVTFGVANESDIGFAAQIIRQTARDLLAEQMRAPVEAYRVILRAQGLDFDVSDEPQVYISLSDAWTNVTVRYLVPARARRHWASELALAVSNELARPEHAERIRPSYPRTRVELVRAPGTADATRPGRA